MVISAVVSHPLLRLWRCSGVPQIELRDVDDSDNSDDSDD
jgi:hypothetical protein